MNSSKLIATIIIATIIVACSSSKKSTTSSTPVSSTTSTSSSTISTASTNTSSASVNTYIVSKPSSGIYTPGSAELNAIQLNYKDVTLEKLKEGYAIYSEGACIKCHSAVNIYIHNQTEWKTIIEDMAQKANISESQKDAVYKYVLSIKATQSK